MPDFSYHSCVYTTPAASCTNADTAKKQDSTNTKTDNEIKTKYDQVMSGYTEGTRLTPLQQCATIDYIHSKYAGGGNLNSNKLQNHLNKRSPDYLGSVHEQALRETNAQKEQTTTWLFIGVVLFLFLLIVAILTSSQRL